MTEVDQTAADAAATTDADKGDGETKHEETVAYERFQQANKKAKDAADKTKALERQLAELKDQVEQAQQAGLPELDQLKKRLEAADKRAEEADRKAAEAEVKLQTTQKERWVTQAAKDFADPDDVVAILQRKGTFTDIESESDAERAVKAIAKDPAKKHLLKSEETVLPGRVLKDGQRTTTERKPGGPDLLEEAEKLAEGLAQFASKG